MNKKAVILILLNLICFVGFSQEKEVVLFENDIVKFLYENKGIKRIIYYNKLEESRAYRVNVRTFPDKKKYLGQERYLNRELEYLKTKYVKKALELESKKNYDGGISKEKIKIVYEIKDNKMFFYYFVANSTHSMTLYKRETKRPPESYYTWSSIEEVFWFECEIDGKIVEWKKFML